MFLSFFLFLPRRPDRRFFFVAPSRDGTTPRRPPPLSSLSFGGSALQGDVERGCSPLFFSQSNPIPPSLFPSLSALVGTFLFYLRQWKKRKALPFQPRQLMSIFLPRKGRRTFSSSTRFPRPARKRERRTKSSFPYPSAPASASKTLPSSLFRGRKKRIACFSLSLPLCYSSNQLPPSSARSGRDGLSFFFFLGSLAGAGPGLPRGLPLFFSLKEELTEKG